MWPLAQACPKQCGTLRTEQTLLWPEHALSRAAHCGLSRHCCGRSCEDFRWPRLTTSHGWSHASLVTSAQETFKLPSLSSSRDPQTSNSSPRRAEEEISSLVWEPFSAGNDTLLYLLTETLFHETLSSVSPNRSNGVENVLSPGIVIPCLGMQIFVYFVLPLSKILSTTTCYIGL